jgi:hypothetical protein
VFTDWYLFVSQGRKLFHSYQSEGKHKKISDQIKTQVNGKSQQSERQEQKPDERIKNQS